MTIRDLLLMAAKKKASDLHLVVGLPPVLRVDGELVYLSKDKILEKKSMETLVFSMISAEQKEKFLSSRDLDFSFEVEDVRFRVNLHFEKGNIGLVARVIVNTIATPEEIGMPDIIYKLLGLKQGLILLTGPTGCGKSTSLAAMIDYINKNRFCNIITFEDPIEYLFEPKKSIIVQRQLGNDMLSFASGLKHALRQDPNVIMVGEMRDLETIATTITLAETGHLVLATLHTYSASQTIDRIIDIFPPHQQNQVRMQLSMTLAGVISQRLLHKVGGGRVAAREVLVNTPAISNMIRENKVAQIKTAIETSAKDGMITMDQELINLYKDGLVSKDSAMAHMSDPEYIKKYNFKKK